MDTFFPYKFLILFFNFGLLVATYSSLFVLLQNKGLDPRVLALPLSHIPSHSWFLLRQGLIKLIRLASNLWSSCLILPSCWEYRNMSPWQAKIFCFLFFCFGAGELNPTLNHARQTLYNWAKSSASSSRVFWRREILFGSFLLRKDPLFLLLRETAKKGNYM